MFPNTPEFPLKDETAFPELTQAQIISLQAVDDLELIETKNHIQIFKYNRIKFVYGTT